MRLRGVVLAAVLTGSVLTGAAASAPPAGAAGNPVITIKAIDRAGKAVAVTASLQSPVISPTSIDETLTSAHTTRVPPGTYNIAAWVNEPGDTAQTLFDYKLVVKGNTTVTFDARKGHRILFKINGDSTVAQDFVLAEPYSPGNYEAFDGFGSEEAPAVYAAPGTMAPGYILSLEADLVRPGEILSPVEYVLVKQIKGSIPANLVFPVDKTTLASDRVTVKAIDPGAFGGAFFQPIQEQSPGILPALPVGQSAIPPFSVEFGFTAGYSWESQTDSGTDNLNQLPVFGVHNYAQTFDSATFGPSYEFGPFLGGNQLSTNWGGSLFDDPTQQLATSFGMQVGSGQVWLYEGKTLLKHTVNAALFATIPASPHWYTMRVTANRPSGAVLWKSETISFNFETEANANGPDVFWPKIIPSGLSLRNTAPHGTSTPVRLYFYDGANIAAHNVRVWASDNGGKTWAAVRVSQSGPHWTADVANPPGPGLVSLRVQGTNAAGSTASVTTINAWAVS